MTGPSFRDFLDRVYIINLPEFEDRRRATWQELIDLGFQPDDPKVEIPYAPRPADPNSFPSRGIHGNFLSHLSILKDAREHRYKRIMVLEDDAIFSRRMARTQTQITAKLESGPWDLCFLGHSANRELTGMPEGLVRSQAEFMWMHCFLVNHTVYDRVIAYFEETLERPPGDPLGGRLYIDGAYNLFRRFNPDVVSYIHNPMISMQRGGPSSLGNRRWYEVLPGAEPVLRKARALRDEAWKRVV